MTMPIHTPLQNRPKITLDWLSDQNVKATFENVPRKMRLTSLNILASGALVIIIEPESSAIIQPDKH